jgi:hypothetical protein
MCEYLKRNISKISVYPERSYQFFLNRVDDALAIKKTHLVIFLAAVHKNFGTTDALIWNQIDETLKRARDHKGGVEESKI